MEQTDRIVLVAGPGPEILAAVLLLAVGVAGFAVSVILLQRKRGEAWPLAVLFAILALFALVALWHVPTGFAVDRKGVDVGFWLFSSHRDWKEVQAFGIGKSKLGLWVVVSQRSSRGGLPISLWAPRFGYFIGGAPIEAGDLATKVTAWRMAAQ
ncbi:MAG: hypothetical protein AB7K64_19405 [Variibacter sp.]